MNLNIKRITSGVSALFLIVSMSGCGKKPAPKQVSNNSLHGPTLSVRYHGNNFQNIYNKEVLGFSLNNYHPLKFDTEVNDHRACSVVFHSSLAKNNKYRNDEVYVTSNDLATNVVGGLISLGIIPIAYGIFGSCETVFDYDKFDEDAKEWVEKNDIDRKMLITKYSELVQYAQEKDQSIRKVYEDNYTTYENEYAEADEKYYSNRPVFVNKYVDKSGLYKKEVLSGDIKVSLNEVVKKDLEETESSNRTYVNAAFPCSGMQECLNNMNKAKEVIDKKSTSSLDKAKVEASEWLTLSREQLTKDTGSYSIEFSDKPLQATFGKKTLEYKIKTKPLVTAGKKAKKVEVVYEIKSFDYSEVLPSFETHNKDLAISFNPETGKITLNNMTDGYIQIKSIDLYHNREIIKLGDSKQKNYSSELSPQSLLTFALTRTIAGSNYKNITKKVALATSVNFGFSVKYSLGDSTKNKTLYKTKKQSLYKLISKL